MASPVRTGRSDREALGDHVLKASPVRTWRSDCDHPNAHGFRLAREETRHVGGIAREDQRRSERSASAATMASMASDVPALARSSPARRAATSVVGTRASPR